MPGRLLHSSLENNNGLPLVPNARAAGLDSCRTAAAARRQHDDDTAASPFSPDSAEEIYAQLRREPDPASPAGLALAKAKSLLLRFGAPEFDAEQARLLAGEEGGQARGRRGLFYGKSKWQVSVLWLEQASPNKATSAQCRLGRAATLSDGLEQASPNAPPRCMLPAGGDPQQCSIAGRLVQLLRGGSYELHR